MGVLSRVVNDGLAGPAKCPDARDTKGYPYVRILLLLALFFAGAERSQADVVLLVEQGPSIYRQAALGFERAFAKLDEVVQVEVDERGRVQGAALAALRRDPPRLVVAIGTLAARAAKESLPAGVSIVYCLALNPEQNNLVGRNIGGVALEVDLSQQFQKIQEALPGLRRLGVVYDDLTSGPLVREAGQYLGDGVQLVARQARTPREAAREIEDLLRNTLGPNDAFWLIWDPVVANPANFRRLVQLSLEYKIPLIAPARPFVEAGALISVGANYIRAGEQAGLMARQILESGSEPGAFSAQAPQEVTLTINREVQRRLGITFPPDLRAEFLGQP